MKKIEKLRLSNWPLGVQIFASIALLFGFLIMIQQFVTLNIFKNFYEQTQASTLKETIIDFRNSLDNDVFDGLWNMAKSTSSKTILINEKNEIIPSTANYSIWLNDEEISLPGILYNFHENDFVSINFYNDTISSISVGDEVITYANLETTRTINGTITKVSRPENLNFLYAYQEDVIDELNNYVNQSLRTYKINESISWYTSEKDDHNFKNLVYIIDLNNGNRAMTIFSIQSTSSMIDSLNIYNFYTYIIIFVFILLTTWYISKYISKPFENITFVANEIANLNFDVVANEFRNHESTTLTNSINAMNHSLKETIDKLNAQNEEMRILSAEKEKQYETKKQFVSAISHEIKTPLAIIQATVSGILDGIFEGDEVNDELKNILKEVNNTSEILQEVLDVYRLDSDGFKLELESLDFITFTQKIINSFDNVLTNSGTTVNYQYEEENVHVLMDYRQMKRVLSNLIVNAIRYSPDQSTIDISIKTSKKELLFEITNYGVNIPKEDIENVFEPFYRVDKTGNRTERKKGSGLGLYICKQVLDKHGFQFGIRNIKNGVTFYIVAKRDIIENKKVD